MAAEPLTVPTQPIVRLALRPAIRHDFDRRPLGQRIRPKVNKPRTIILYRPKEIPVIGFRFVSEVSLHFSKPLVSNICSTITTHHAAQRIMQRERLPRVVNAPQQKAQRNTASARCSICSRWGPSFRRLPLMLHKCCISPSCTICNMRLNAANDACCRGMKLFLLGGLQCLIASAIYCLSATRSKQNAV